MADALARLEDGFEAGVVELLSGVPALEDVLQGLSPEQAHRYGRDAARQALAPLVWRAAAGEVLSTEQVRALLGVTRQALHKRVEAGTLLGLPGELTTLYPAWQFERSGVRGVVPAVIAAFRERLGPEYDARMVASWATSGQPDLKGATPAEWLSDGLDPDAVVLAAERAADALVR